ncbi:MAG: hypothetical protein ACXVUL_13560 [Solirubrobacteraceae bacterium]
MNRLTVAVVAAMLALPASAAAAPTRGVVLSVNAGRHTIQVVDGKHRAHAYRYRGSLPRLHPGSRISFARRGHTIGSVRVGPGKTVSFYGRVVRSNASGLTLRLSDGATVSFSSKQVSAVRKRMNAQWHKWRSLTAASLHVNTGGSTVNINGLAPGTIVLVTETIANGHTTITVTLPGGSQGSRGGGGGQSSNQSGNQTGSGDQSDDNGDNTGGDALGTITQLSQTAVTINAGGHSMTFSCDPEDDLTDGFAVGDLVDVTYDASNGSLIASDVEYVEADATGTVTAVDPASLTLTNSDTGQTQTIVADPAEDMFDGVSVGDGVVVTYHQSAGQLIADVVDDETAGN